MKKVTVQQGQGATFLAKADSNHWVVMDSIKKFGGSEAATKPMEMLLMSLGGCTGMDVLSLLKKMRVDIDDFRIEISAERADEHPKVYTKIDLVYFFKGKEIDRDKVDKAVSLSQDKYCSVSAILKETAELTHSIEIEESE
ncbi:MAG TPA: OsmC family protein [bacterium]|nr:OsmC family protein [bacterium]